MSKRNDKDKRITLRDLMSRKEQSNGDKKKIYKLEINDEELQDTIQCKTLDRAVLLDAFDLEDGQGDLYLIYESCIDPNFKDVELQKELGCRGYEIIEKIFQDRPGLIASISMKILQKHGYNSKVDFVKDIKN